MKRTLSLLGILIVLTIIVASCEKAPFLTVSSSRSLSFADTGGNQTISFTCNRDWTISSSESWLKVAPSSGPASDETVTVTIICDANSTYDPRSGSLLVSSEGMQETISVDQESILGLFTYPSSFDLSNEEQIVSIKAQSNVPFTVVIEEECKSWIRLISSKGLSESSISLQIAKNEGYDRIGYIRLLSEVLSEVIVIKQKSPNIVFDDTNFKAYCVDNFDEDGDGEVSLTEASKVTIIDTWHTTEKSYDIIYSVKGIECFPNLEVFSCQGYYSSIDLSNNTALKFLECSGGYKELDLSNNLNLEYVYCCGNLSSLDLSNHVALDTLSCPSSRITNLNISGCISLKSLSCQSNQLSRLDLSECPLLASLECRQNQFSYLDLSANTALEVLGCGENNLFNLDISNNLNLTYLDCSNNHLSNLDISKNTKLKSLNCSYNKLSNLDISNNHSLLFLGCGHNQLNSIDVHQCDSLITLSCEANSLSNLDVKNNNSLQNLKCGWNSLTELEVKNCKALVNLWCESNSITDLDVSSCPLLLVLICGGNGISTINLEGCTSLANLDCVGNCISNLNIKSCVNLQFLTSSHNPFSTIDLTNNTLLASLAISECENLVCLDVSNNLALSWLSASNNPILAEIWLKTGQTIQSLYYDSNITTIKYKD